MQEVKVLVGRYEARDKKSICWFSEQNIVSLQKH